MSASLSTHVLDTAAGRPAVGVTVELLHGAEQIVSFSAVGSSFVYPPIAALPYPLFAGAADEGTRERRSWCSRACNWARTGSRSAPG